MRRPLSLKTRRELTEAIIDRYQAAYRPGKKAILDEFAKLTGYHRRARNPGHERQRESSAQGRWKTSL